MRRTELECDREPSLSPRHSRLRILRVGRDVLCIGKDFFMGVIHRVWLARLPVDVIRSITQEP
jgi:hypothetical protein